MPADESAGCAGRDERAGPPQGARSAAAVHHLAHGQVRLRRPQRRVPQPRRSAPPRGPRARGRRALLPQRARRRRRVRWGDARGGGLEGSRPGTRAARLARCCTGGAARSDRAQAGPAARRARGDAQRGARAAREPRAAGAEDGGRAAARRAVGRGGGRQGARLAGAGAGRKPELVLTFVRMTRPRNYCMQSYSYIEPHKLLL
mmetsp:Transcript_33927/g.84443  ORF Transcript_33927/g.84443 Transcript_33927/m.84443 type:complete len:203 (+) Transcript_33927:418-1026(+)